MSRLFISHASENTAEAVAVRDWLVSEGWDDIFLDTDPARGIRAGENWKQRLKEAGSRCEAVLFLVSPFWLKSDICRAEFNLADYSSKHLFGVVLEGAAIDDLPGWLTADPQFVSISKAAENRKFTVQLPRTGEKVDVEFSVEGLDRLKIGLQAASFDAKYFEWPPIGDLDRPPYRGLRQFESADAGIFFGRDGPISEALDSLRKLRSQAPPRLFVILGASGAGKTSFLRAGLLPRLARDDRHFLPLPIIRPERSAIEGNEGFLAALEKAFRALHIPTTRATLRAAFRGGVNELRSLLQKLAEKATPRILDSDNPVKPPTLILSVDQCEELFLAEGQSEAQPLLTLLRDLLADHGPPLIVLLAIRSESYGQLQETMDGIHKVPFDLGAMPIGSYAEVIKGPARRSEGTTRPLTVEDTLVEALLTDMESGGAKDALPLLAFTLERLYVEHGGDGDLTLAEYGSFGGIRGAIEEAVERAFEKADSDSRIPRNQQARLALLHRGLIPWLAGIDPETGSPRRRIARMSEIPEEAEPLIKLLVEQRLLATDKDAEGEITIEPVHEALLRQWSALKAWLHDDFAILVTLENVKRAARDWRANASSPDWLNHAASRLQAAEAAAARPEYSKYLSQSEIDYLRECRNRVTETENAQREQQTIIDRLTADLSAAAHRLLNLRVIGDFQRKTLIFMIGLTAAALLLFYLRPLLPFFLRR